jgi:hypothetical protein
VLKYRLKLELCNDVNVSIYSARPVAYPGLAVVYQNYYIFFGKNF